MHNNIESHLVEKRVFKPPQDFAAKARIKSLDQYRRMYRESIRQPAKFWAREASELIWRAPWKKVLHWSAPFAEWFVGGKLNISENCLDRHLIGPRRNKAAIAMLACARIGAVHSVVFGGFSADSIRDRITDSGAIAVVTADGAHRRGGSVPLKKNVDDALRGRTSIKRVIVFRRAGNEIHMEKDRDVWWHRELEYVDANCPPTPLGSEHPLYLLYTSGSTGKPKGILHTTGGYLVGVYSTMKYVFDIRDEDIFWCTADVGW